MRENGAASLREFATQRPSKQGGLFKRTRSSTAGDAVVVIGDAAIRTQGFHSVGIAPRCASSVWGFAGSKPPNIGAETFALGRL